MLVGQTTSNAAIFDNCTFIKNSAQEFGSAISLSTLDPFRQVENSNPSKIINWFVCIHYSTIANILYKCK